MSEPAEEETNAGGEEAGAETTVEPGEEVRWNTGNMLQTYSQGNHESNDEISLEAEDLDIMAYSRDGIFVPMAVQRRPLTARRCIVLILHISEK